MKTIAVIGGGPKAAALCAKAEVLNRTGVKVRIRVFEKRRLGAAWLGRNGYSDGAQRLCTPPERDVGFPYERGLLDRDGVRDLFADYSWQSFLVERGGTTNSYRDWVDRGRKPPTHELYARYVRWVIDQSAAQKTIGEVTGLTYGPDGWDVTYTRRLGHKSFTAKGFDGVVVTGPGPALKGFTRPANARITDGVAFWNDPEGFIEQEGEDPIVIAGSGGTAAAIAAWIARARDNRPILIVGNQAALFTRTESFFENAMYSDEDAWAALKPEERIGASQRLNRGVVWSSVSEALSQVRNVRFRPGRVEKAFVEPGVNGAPPELRVEIRDARESPDSAASLIIDAAGFDPWWFANLLAPGLKARTLKAGQKTQAQRRDDLVQAMNEDLTLDIGAPGLHAPMLSHAQGPGFASLMVLGAMSERILRPYV